MVQLRAFTVAVSLLCALAACHPDDKRPIVRVDVFEDHVSVDGARSDMPIQQAVDTQTQSRDVLVVFVTPQPLSATRRDELRRSIDKIAHSTEVGVRQVLLSPP
jgi:hypothetical protein